MKAHSRRLKLGILPALLITCLGVTSIDSILKYSWGENIGWLNWRDANGGNQGVEYHSNYLAGYIWGENVGFVNVGNGGGPYANTNDTNFGVNILGGGNLAGYAWGENIGWLNFDTTAALGGAGQQARYDAGASRFRGYVWGENVGWINLDDPTNYVAVAGVPTISIMQWRSVRTHTAAGELAIVLDPAATGATSTKPTVETRGATVPTQGVFKVQVDFSSPVTLVNAANITVTYRPTIQGGSPSIGSPVSVIPSSVVMANADTLDMIFTSGQIPNLGCANISIGAGTFTQTIAGDTDCNIRVLAGDVNSNGTVTIADVLSIKAEASASTLTTAKPKFDINLSGTTITIADELAAKSQTITPSKTALCP